MSKVYFTDFRAVDGRPVPQKLKNLLLKSDLSKIDFKNKFVAIKVHFGEPGNITYLRPNLAKVLVDVVKSFGGKPFLTDCNTLYPGRRKNALEHLDAAQENGFYPLSVGCQNIIADGIKGTDEALVPVKNGELVQLAKIGKAIYDADIVLSLSHFKGHESTGFGGALKNLGMGSGSRAGKMEQHCNGKPDIKPDKCVCCKLCAKSCAQNAISYDTGKAVIDHDKCVGCGRCIGACNFDAVYNNRNSANADLCKKIAEYTQAVIQDKPNYHINIVMDVSPYCDCYSAPDVAIIPNVGMFASADPVALDCACADACNKMPSLPNSLLTDEHNDIEDHFTHIAPTTNWKDTMTHAEKIGVGSMKYELITIK